MKHGAAPAIGALHAITGLCRGAQASTARWPHTSWGMCGQRGKDRDYSW